MCYVNDKICCCFVLALFIVIGAIWYGLMCATCDVNFMVNKQYLALKAIIIGFVLTPVCILCLPRKVEWNEPDKERSTLRRSDVVNHACCGSKFLDCLLVLSLWVFWCGLGSFVSWILFVIFRSFDECCN